MSNNGYICSACHVTSSSPTLGATRGDLVNMCTAFCQLGTENNLMVIWEPLQNNAFLSNVAVRFDYFPGIFVHLISTHFYFE